MSQIKLVLWKSYSDDRCHNINLQLCFKETVDMKVSVAQSCLTLCNLMDCSLPGSSVHGILQARIVEWVAMPSSRGSSQHRGWTWISRTAGRFFTIWTTREAWRRSKNVKLRKGTGVKRGINEGKQDAEGRQARKRMCSRNWKRDGGGSWLAQVRHVQGHSEDVQVLCLSPQVNAEVLRFTIRCRHLKGWLWGLPWWSSG